MGLIPLVLAAARPGCVRDSPAHAVKCGGKHRLDQIVGIWTGTAEELVAIREKVTRPHLAAE